MSESPALGWFGVRMSIHFNDKVSVCQVVDASVNTFQVLRILPYFFPIDFDNVH